MVATVADSLEFEQTAWAGLQRDRYSWTAVLHGVDQVDEVATEAVDLPDDEHVARPERAHTAVEPRAVVADAGRDVVVDVDGVDACSALRCRSSDWEPSAFETRA